MYIEKERHQLTSLVEGAEFTSARRLRLRGAAAAFVKARTTILAIGLEDRSAYVR